MAMIDAQTRLFAVIGNPLGHSLSPVLHNTFLSTLGINGVYVALPIEDGRLEQAVAGLFAAGLGGVNVTIPYKEAVIPYLKALTPQAQACQAVNTLIPADEGFIGDNTDGAGLLAALEEEHGWQACGRRILLAGAGGAAKGVATALALAGAEEIMVVNRSLARAEALAQWIGQLGSTRGQALPQEALAEKAIYAHCDTIINTTSVGMSPQVEAMIPLRTAYLTTEHLVADIIYNPLETRLLREARQQGARTSSGLGMFIHQGALSLEKWLGVRPQTQPLYEKLREILMQRNGR